jgi:hypothetical protein
MDYLLEIKKFEINFYPLCNHFFKAVDNYIVRLRIP